MLVVVIWSKIGQGCGFLPEITYTKFQLSSLNSLQVINMSLYPFRVKIDAGYVWTPFLDLQLSLIFKYQVDKDRYVMFLSQSVKHIYLTFACLLKGQIKFYAKVKLFTAPTGCRSSLPFI